MRSPRVLDSNKVASGLVHAQTIVSHSCSCHSPCASFQGKDTYMPGRNADRDVCWVIMRVDVPELRSILN